LIEDGPPRAVRFFLPVQSSLPAIPSEAIVRDSPKTCVFCLVAIRVTGQLTENNMKAFAKTQHDVPKTVVDVPGFPALKVTVYQYQKEDELGFYISKDDTPTAVAELLPEEQVAVRAFMKEHYPKHAALLGPGKN
jgi:hypothetical protein